MAEHKSGAPICCDLKMKQQLTSGFIGTGFNGEKPFINQPDPKTGEILTSHRQIKEVRARHGLMDSRELDGAQAYIKKRRKIKAKRDQQAADLDPMTRLGKFNLQET